MAQPYRRHDAIHFVFPGARTRVVDVMVPVGPSTLLDILPAARALSNALTEEALEAERAEGRTITCRAGCGACCRQMVGISAVEAMGLVELIAAMPEERRAVIEGRFREARSRLVDAGLLEGRAHGETGFRHFRGLEPGRDRESGRAVSMRYAALRISCPFLEDESCSIYEERPLSCREYNVTSPARNCAQPQDAPVRKATPPIHAGALLGRIARRLTAVPVTILPIVQSLEWAREYGEALKTVQDGEAMYRAFLVELQAVPDGGGGDG